MQSTQLPGFITRQSVLVVVLLLALLFFILALALPWYKITEENVPYPSWSGNETANVISTFYWTGVTISITPTDAQAIPRPSPTPTPAAASATPSLSPSPATSPVAVDNSTATNSSSMSALSSTASPTPATSFAPGTNGTTTKKKMPWSEFPTGAVEARMMASLGLLLAAVGLNLVLLGPILFAHNLLRARFGHKATKWVLLGVSLAMIICAFLSWFLFFGLCESFALDESYCPDEAYLGLSVFDEEKYWCTTFIGERSNVGTFRTHFQWGPMSGFWLALGGAIVSIVASFFVFILKGPSVEELGQKRPLMHDHDYVSYH